MSRGKDEKALEILAKYHANGNRDDPLVRFEFAEMKASIVDGEQKGRWLDLVKTRKSHERYHAHHMSDDANQVYKGAIVTESSSPYVVAFSRNSLVPVLRPTTCTTFSSILASIAHTTRMSSTASSLCATCSRPGSGR